jgi:5-methylthioadenosine/S-adenosylhomocysteine deaminase
MTDLLIYQCDVLRLENGQPVVDSAQDILIDGNRITAVRPSQPVIPGEADRVISAGGLLAIPGLINTHAHIAMTLFRGMVEDVSVNAWFNDYIWPVESNLTPEDVYWGALLGIAEMIEAGVTCVADHYFAMDEVAQAVSDSGMRANLAWAVFAHEGLGKLDETSGFVERWQGKAGGRITTYLGPHAPYTTTPEFLQHCASRAKELETGIHIHVSETADQVKLSLEQLGKTPVQELADAGVFEVPTILAHCAFPQDVDFPILAGAGTGIAHAPKTYLKLGSGIPNLGKFLQNGIPVGLASDGAASSNTLDILEQMRLMALTQKDLARDSTVFPVGQVLDVAFRGGARVLHCDQDLGELSPGKLADIALLRQDGMHVFPRYDPAANLVYSSRASDVDTVICDGQVLLQGGRLLTIDKAQIKRQIHDRLARLSQRVPGRRIAFYPA